MNIDKSLFRYIIVPALITGFLLLIPLVAMQFTDEVAWTLSDFVVAGILLFGTGLTYKLVTRKSDETVYRVAVGLALATGFFLIWANGAVGIIGSENNPINLLYYLVLFVGIIGAFIARFRSHELSLTMFAMALAQASIAAIALGGGYYQSPPSSVFEILTVNGFFITLFVVSALLFRYAAQEQTPMNLGAEE